MGKEAEEREDSPYVHVRYVPPDESYRDTTLVAFVVVVVYITSMLWEPYARRFRVAACRRIRSHCRGRSRSHIV